MQNDENETRNVVALLQLQEQATLRAVQIGESDKLALAGIRIQSAVAARARLDALHRVQSALGVLEDAAQLPLE